MPTTPSRGLPYPSLASANDPPRDLQLLAEAVDADLTTLFADPVGTSYSSETVGGGAITTAWTLASTPATLALPAGTFLVAGTCALSLSPGAQMRIDAGFSVGTDTGYGNQASHYVDVGTGGSQTPTIEWSRLVVLASTSALTIRARTSAASGTLVRGAQGLYAIQVA